MNKDIYNYIKNLPENPKDVKIIKVNQDKHYRKSRTDKKVELLNTKSLEELQQEVRTKAKRANQRMVRLERSEDLESSYAYKNAQNYLDAKGRMRFKESPKKMNREQLQEELVQLDRFLDSKTSTNKGTKEVNRNKKSALNKTLSKITKTDINDKDVKDLSKLLKNDRLVKLLSRLWDSKQVLKAMYEYKNNPNVDLVGLFQSVEEQLEAMDDKTYNRLYKNDKIPIRSKEQAEILNKIFKVKVFKQADYSPVLTDEDDDSETVDII